MRFVDLFAGLGGFHLALEALGHECVFASEIDEGLRALYSLNFGMPAAGDIRTVTVNDIPAHDVLCAGFPCQPFSKAGFQDGFEHATDGTLFNEILRVLSHHRPEHVILENVANFERHDHGHTWIVAKHSLERLGYDIRIAKLSPHEYGVPQIRERVYIVGRLGKGALAPFEWPKKQPFEGSVHDKLDRDPPEGRRVSDKLLHAIDAWQQFLDRFPTNEELPSFPIWSMEFGATYPIEGINPSVVTLKWLRQFKGSHGQSLSRARRWDQVWEFLPSHAHDPVFPNWKQRFLMQNRDLYQRHADWVGEWMPAMRGLPSSFQKLEWNCKGEVRQLELHILQARPSGIRVKRANWAPALVALTTSQVPIVGWETRYMTLEECKRLQSMDALKFLPERLTQAYQALGNAVNSEVVTQIGRALLHGTASCRPSRQETLSLA